MQAVSSLPVVSALVNYYPSQSSLVGGVFCGVVAAEMAIRALGDLFKKTRLEEGSSNKEEEVARNFSANFGGAVFYGLCAANILPGTAILGGLLFVGYCFYKSKADDDYLIKKVLTQGTSSIVDLGVRLLETIWNVFTNSGSFLWNRIISPVAHVIRHIVANVFDIIVPRHPIWIGVALLVTAIAIVKLPVLLLV